MINVTLNQIKAHSPCKNGWTKLLNSLNKTQADDELLPLSHILESNGLDDALWSLRVLTGDDLIKAKLLICDIAERALKFVPDDELRTAKSIEMARKYIRGECTIEELNAAADNAFAVDAAYIDAAYIADETARAFAADYTLEREIQAQMFKDFCK